MTKIIIRCAKCNKPISDLNKELHGTFCKGFKPTTKPVNVKDGAIENRGWTVFGSQEYKQLEGGGIGYTQVGYIFDNEADARAFYESESK